MRMKLEGEYIVRGTAEVNSVEIESDVTTQQQARAQFERFIKATGLPESEAPRDRRYSE